MGYRVETSLMVAELAIAALVVVAMIVWSAARVLRSPDQVSLFFRHRRAMKGYLAISRGLIAIGAGDARGAQLARDEAAAAVARRSFDAAVDRAVGTAGRRPRRR